MEAGRTLGNRSVTVPNGTCWRTDRSGRLAQALFHVPPDDLEGWKPVNALLGEREALRTEAKRAAALEREPALFDRDG